MARLYPNRVMEDAGNQPNAATAYDLSGSAETGFQTFASQLSNGDTIRYLAEQVDANGNPSGAWEIGLGTYNDLATDTITRSLEDSSTGSLIDWSSVGATPRLSVIISDADAVVMDRRVLHIQLNAGASSPADSTTYFLGAYATVGWNTTSTIHRLYVPRAGTLTDARVTFAIAGTQSSTETFSIWVRVNDSTDVLITSTATLDAAVKTFVNTSLSHALSAGDYLAIKLTTPVWATNPTNVVMTGYAHIQVAS